MTVFTNYNFSNSNNDNKTGHQMIDGKYENVYRDEHGEYYLNSENKKVYLAEYFDQLERNKEKERVGQDLRNFITGQYKDFSKWSEYYFEMAQKYRQATEQNKKRIKTLNELVSDNTSILNPILSKYETDDPKDINNVMARNKATGLFTENKTAKRDINSAWTSYFTEREIQASYERLGRHSDMCGDVVKNIFDQNFG